MFFLLVFSCKKDCPETLTKGKDDHIRLKEITEQDDWGIIHTKFSYYSKGLLESVIWDDGGSDFGIIAVEGIGYSSSDLPISGIGLKSSFTIEWGSNNSSYTIWNIDNKGVKKKVRENSLDSNNNIDKFHFISPITDSGYYLNLKWIGDSLNCTYNDSKSYCKTYIQSDKKSPFLNINIALPDALNLGIGFSHFDFQNLFCPLKYKDYDVPGHSTRKTYTYTFNDDGYPTSAKILYEFPDINYTNTSESNLYFEYEKY